MKQQKCFKLYEASNVKITLLRKVRPTSRLYVRTVAHRLYSLWEVCHNQ
jgi:hypothetical protein